MKPFYQMDAQAALGFVTHQRSHIEPEVLKKEYAPTSYAALIPVDTSAADYAPSVTFFSQENAGRAKFINGKADDVPLVDMQSNKYEQTVHMAALGYSFSLEEIGAAQQLGVNLSNEGADMAREAADQTIDKLAFAGTTATSDGLAAEGLFNMTGIGSTAATGTFNSLTPDQIIADVMGLVGAIKSASKNIDIPDTLVVPIATETLLNTKRLTDTSLTLSQYLQQAASANGTPMTIRGSHHLTDKAVMYRRDPRVLKMHMPMPLTFIPPQSQGLEIVVHGMFRVAPVSVRRPNAVRYLTGVAA